MEFRGEARPSDLKILDTGSLDRLHIKLGALRVSLPSTVTTDSIRQTFSKIRAHRNTVALIMAKIFPILGSAKAQVVRLDRIIEAESSILRDTKAGLLGTKTEKDRQSRINIILDDLIDAKAETKMASIELQELSNHCKITMDELRAAFEEVSRMLSTYELDYRISKSDSC